MAAVVRRRRHWRRRLAGARPGRTTSTRAGRPRGKFTNHSWAITSNTAQISTVDCADSDASPRIVMTSSAEQAYAPGEGASIVFRAPAGSDDRRLPDRPLHAAVQPGRQLSRTALPVRPRPARGDPVRAYGRSHGLGHTGHRMARRRPGGTRRRLVIVTRARFGSLSGYAGDAGQLSYTMGCQPDSGCALGTNGDGGKGSINLAVFSATRDGQRSDQAGDRADPADLVWPPVASSAGMSRWRSTRGTTPASSSRELVDATPGGPEKIVGERRFACDYSYAAPCPQATGAEITPSGLPAGKRLLKLQVTDAGGNVTESPLFPVVVGGPGNGARADAKAKLTDRVRTEPARDDRGPVRQAREHPRPAGGRGGRADRGRDVAGARPASSATGTSYALRDGGHHRRRRPLHRPARAGRRPGRSASSTARGTLLASPDVVRQSRAAGARRARR